MGKPMEQLRVLRKAVGLSQAELAKRINRSLITVFRWEKGIRNPDIEELRLLATELNCSVSDLVEIQENPTEAPARRRRTTGA